MINHMKKNLLPMLMLVTITTPGYSQHGHPPISVSDYFRAFSQVPDSGKTVYTISLMVAVPNVRHPLALVSVPNPLHPKEVASASRWRMGHVFLMLHKGDSARQVTQYIGFYAQSPMRAYLSGKAVPSKIIDNGKHRFDAALTMRLNAHQFQEVLNYVLLHAHQPYSVFRYNCVHFALGAINTVRSRPLVPHVKRVPGLNPQGLLFPGNMYQLICQMRSGPEAGNVYVAAKDTCAGASYGKIH
jgi:hypothetical protein